MHLHPLAGRLSRGVIAAVLLGGVLALVPVPRLVATAAAMETETRRPPVVPAATAEPGVAPAGQGSAGPTTVPIAREEGVGRFVMLGATVPVADGEVQARVRTGGRWGEWFPLHHSSDHGPDPDSEEGAVAVASATEPVWVGGADGYELRLPDGVGDVEVHVVHEGDRQIEVSLDEPADGAPAIRPRSSWGARAPSAGPFYAPDLHMAVVHHSAGANGYTAAQVPGIIRAMQAYHMDANGWYDLAYNFVVDRFGVVWEGRGGGVRSAVVGGHSAGFNTGTTGVVVLGDYNSATAPAATLNAVAEVIAWKFALHGVDPSSRVDFTTVGSSSHTAGTYTFPRVVGHRDVGATACPGARLYSALPSIRSRVTSRYGAHLHERPRVVFGVDLGGDGRTEVVRYRAGSHADEIWRPDETGRMTSRPVGIGGTYRPIVGDFDGDGREDVFWHGTGSTQDHLWWGAPGNTYTPVLYDVRGSFQPFVGDFDGNGVDDIYWYAPGLAPDVIWYLNANRTRNPVVRSVPHTAPPFVGDFDGDGIDDVFWYEPGATGDLLWYGNPNRTFESHTFRVGLRYVPIPGDFDGDGRDDIIWYAPGSVTDHHWHAEGPRGSMPNSQLSIGGLLRPITVDAAADGATDILWYAPGPVLDELWSFAPGGSVTTSSRQVGMLYDVVSGDFDGDGYGDLLWSGASLASSHRWHGGPDGSLTPGPAG